MILCLRFRGVRWLGRSLPCEDLDPPGSDLAPESSTNIAPASLVLQGGGSTYILRMRKDVIARLKICSRTRVYRFVLPNRMKVVYWKITTALESA